MNTNRISIKFPRYFLGLFLISLLYMVGCQSQNSQIVLLETPMPVIVDVDMAHEDMFAVLYLLQHPNVDVKAITVAATGEAHCDSGSANALGMVALAGQENIPVACGAELPLKGDHAFPSAWRQNADNAYGVSIVSGGEPSELSAPELIIQTIQNTQEKVTIVAVGPLTNIADVLQNNPEIIANIEMIYVMGGAVKSGGNVGVSGVGIDNDYAEWNIYIDPFAAKIVFESGAPITLIPLDATKYVPTNRDFYDQLGENRDTPSANFVYDMLTANLDFVGCCGFQHWDSFTAAVSTDESIASFEEFQLIIIDDEGPESGRTKIDPNGSNIRVATNANKAQFENLFLEILNWED